VGDPGPTVFDALGATPQRDTDDVTLG
jgi:hypothetical protein